MELKKAVHCFRNALFLTIETESHKVFTYSGWAELNAFPHGSCDIASNFLGQFLIDCGFAVDVIYCNGAFKKVPGVRSHVWLEVNEYYVDLTGCQFKLENDRVIFREKKERTWLRDYFELCKADGNANISGVEINTAVDNRGDLYEYIADRARTMLAD